LPLELISLLHSCSHKEVNDVSRMSIHGNQTHDLLSYWLGKVTLHHHDESFEVVDLGLVDLSHSIWV
jgi:hypothetical protein